MKRGLFKVLFQDISPRLLNSFRLTDSGEILWFVGTRKRILACILKHEERKVNQLYCNAVISQHVLHLTFLPLFSPSLQTLSPWVGLRKINVSYWGWEDMSPFTNTSLRWLPGEPSDSGFCAYLERAHVAGLKANPCTATSDGLICEKPAGEKE